MCPTCTAAGAGYGHAMSSATPRVAIAHDYLTQRGGAERVVLALARAFPEAPIYTTLFEPDRTFPEFGQLDVRTSWLNRVGPLRRNHRAALPLLPLASSSILIDADVVIASSSGWAHGFRCSGHKLVYCYTPARWLYDSDRYLGDSARVGLRNTLRVLRPSLRAWDKRAARSASRYLAISSVTQDRIRKTYGYRAAVVPAPHAISSEVLSQRSSVSSQRIPNSGYMLVVSRLLPYKNVRPIVEAFAARRDLRLVVVGSGPQKEELQRVATPNVSFLEGLTDQELWETYASSAGLVAASHEDFGLTPLEAAAFGKPSAVLRWGGFLDTVVEGVTGVFFEESTPDLIGRAVDQLLAASWNEQALLDRAATFSEPAFAARIKHHVNELRVNASSRTDAARVEELPS